MNGWGIKDGGGGGAAHTVGVKVVEDDDEVSGQLGRERLRVAVELRDLREGVRGGGASRQLRASLGEGSLSTFLEPFFLKLLVIPKFSKPDSR